MTGGSWLAFQYSLRVKLLQS